jgi:hypothetical protein
MAKREAIEKTFKVKGQPHVIKRLERFFAMLHYNGQHGHSGLFAMPLDGDGPERLEISPLDKNLKNEVDAIAGVGGGVEIAYDNSYGVKNVKPLSNDYSVKSSGTLYKNGKIVKTVPSQDWEYSKGV